MYFRRRGPPPPEKPNNRNKSHRLTKPRPEAKAVKVDFTAAATPASPTPTADPSWIQQLNLRLSDKRLLESDSSMRATDSFSAAWAILSCTLDGDVAEHQRIRRSHLRLHHDSAQQRPLYYHSSAGKCSVICIRPHRPLTPYVTTV